MDKDPVFGQLLNDNVLTSNRQHPYKNFFLMKLTYR